MAGGAGENKRPVVHPGSKELESLGMPLPNCGMMQPSSNSDLKIISGENCVYKIKLSSYCQIQYILWVILLLPFVPPAEALSLEHHYSIS